MIGRSENKDRENFTGTHRRNQSTKLSVIVQDSVTPQLNFT